MTRMPAAGWNLWKSAEVAEGWGWYCMVWWLSRRFMKMPWVRV